MSPTNSGVEAADHYALTVKTHRPDGRCIDVRHTPFDRVRCVRFGRIDAKFRNFGRFDPLDRTVRIDTSDIRTRGQFLKQTVVSVGYDHVRRPI